MPNDKPRIPHVKISIDGAPLSDVLADTLKDLEVDTSLGMPDMAVLRFADNGDFAIVKETKFATGKALTIKFEEFSPSANQPALNDVFTGEITAVEADFNAELGAYINVTAFDKTHRLSRATRSKVYKDVTHSDVVTQITGAAGVTLEKDATTTTYKHVFQDNVTDREFIDMLAQRNGYVTFTKAGKLQFKKNTDFATTAIPLEWGTTLRQFRPRLTLAGQVDKIEVKGWDVQQKAVISGVKTSSSSHATPGIATASGGSMASSGFAAAARLETRSTHPISQTDAEKVAQGVLDTINAETVEAEGMCWGSSKICIGVKLQITGVGQRFNGTYIPSSVTHRYSPDGYFTYFRVEGLRAKTMSALVNGNGHSQNGTEIVHSGEKWAGVYPAIVTVNAKDTSDAISGYGSVKVKFPWLAEDQESYWARVAAPNAGNQYGILWLPEVGDEVLVAFEGGDFNHPYVLGGLWNGQDALPESIDDVAKGGKIEVRTLKTRIGHIIRLIDESGKEKIEIIDGKGKFNLTMDSANEKITLHCTKDIEVKADGGGKIDVLSDSGPVNVKTTGDITVDAGSGNVSMKGTNVSIEATSAMTVKGATVSVQAQGTAELKGNGPVTVQSSAITAVKGSLVQIN